MNLGAGNIDMTSGSALKIQGGQRGTPTRPMLAKTSIKRLLRINETNNNFRDGPMAG